MAPGVHESPPLFRNTQRGYIGGVCAGLADYAGIDVLYVRSAFVLVSIFGGGDFRAIPIALYLVLWVAAPKRPMAASEVPNGVRFVLLGLLVASALMLAMTLQGPGRLGGGLVAAPVVIAVAAAVIRRDTLLPKLALVTLGVVASGALFVLTYNPTLGTRSERPATMHEIVPSRPFTTVAGDLRLDLAELTHSISSGRVIVPVVAFFSDVTIIIPGDRNVTVEQDGEPRFTQRVDAGQEVVINVDLDGLRNSLEVVRRPPSVMPAP